MEWIRILILSLGLSFCVVGMEQDRKERKFSNKYILCIMALGLVIAYMGNRLPASLVTFLAINVLGIFMSALHIFGASDWKLFASVGLYVPIFTKPEYGIVFAICFVIYGIYQKIKVVNSGHLLESLKDEWNALKYFILTRKRLTIEEDSRGVYKEATVAASEGIVFAFFITAMMLI